jgi:hypothetical protein
LSARFQFDEKDCVKAMDWGPSVWDLKEGQVIELPDEPDARSSWEKLLDRILGRKRVPPTITIVD